MRAALSTRSPARSAPAARGACALLLSLVLSAAVPARAQQAATPPARPVPGSAEALAPPRQAGVPPPAQQKQQQEEDVSNGKATVMPPGWFLAGLAPHHYEVQLDPQSPCEGARAAHLRSRVDQPSGYGTFMQGFRADDYRGKRVRYSALVRTKDVEGWAGLFMRVDGRDVAQPLAFDNMQTRALVGNTPCQRYEVVLDVPRDAKLIWMGLMLSGVGNAWIGGVKFDVVDQTVASTDLLGGVLGSSTFVVDGPANLGFQPDLTEDQATGRIGKVWFNRVRVENGQRGVRLKDGTWHGVFTEARVKGRTVEGTFEKREGHFTVSREGQDTRVEGTWGRYPVSIRFGPERLEMRWGERVRTLSRARTEAVEANCVRYVRSDGGLARIDQLDLCGEALVPMPPPAQLVMSLLANGFERPDRVDSVFTPTVGEPHHDPPGGRSGTGRRGGQ